MNDLPILESTFDKIQREEREKTMKKLIKLTLILIIVAAVFKSCAMIIKETGNEEATIAEIESSYVSWREPSSEEISSALQLRADITAVQQSFVTSCSTTTFEEKKEKEEESTTSLNYTDSVEEETSFVQKSEYIDEQPQTIAAKEENTSYAGYYKLTAYCACSHCCGKWADGGTTASGTKACQGRTVACNSIDLGTVIDINGHTYIVEDTGGMGMSTIDIFFNSHQEALDFGVQYSDVYIIE